MACYAQKPGGVVLRVCHLDTTSGFGVFGSAPVAGRIAERAEVGAWGRVAEHAEVGAWGRIAERAEVRAWGRVAEHAEVGA
eukprot:365277-Chlamydomonas_euryale.AAC.14